jgi:hypothetical protein
VRTWLGQRYLVSLIDDELRSLAAVKLSTRPADPSWPELLLRIDYLLDQRLQETVASTARARI